MLQTSDIQEAVVQLWNGSINPTTGLTVVVPGGLHFGRVPEYDANGILIQAPYASYTVQEKLATYTGLPGYVQPYLVEIRIYSDQQGEPTGEITRTLDTVFDIPPASLPLSLNLNNKQVLLILHGNRQPGEVRIDENRRRANDVLMAAGRYELLCQGSRP